MASEPAPKSILKSSSKYTATHATADSNRALALHHAQLIQDQRNADTQILDATLQLIDLPERSKDPAQPVPAEAVFFKKAV